jgi:uncharacterized protein
MKCPKCNSAMEAVTVEGIEVNRCTSCQGLWFDALEHEALQAQAKAIDTGSAAKGAKQNAVDRIKCPVCSNTQMLRMVDARQSHIWFESCPSCYGRFFDAGEFRDLSTKSVMDFVRGAFTGERK